MRAGGGALVCSLAVHMQCFAHVHMALALVLGVSLFAFFYVCINTVMAMRAGISNEVLDREMERDG